MDDTVIRPAFDRDAVTESAFLTANEAAKELGISKKGVYRCAIRAEADGHTVRTRIGSVRFVMRSALPILRRYYYHPQDASPEAVMRRKVWGSRGSAEAAKSPRRGRPRLAQPPRVARWEDGITLRALKAARRFVNECGGSIEAARAAVLAISSMHPATGAPALAEQVNPRVETELLANQPPSEEPMRNPLELRHPTSAARGSFFADQPPRTGVGEGRPAAWGTSANGTDDFAIGSFEAAALLGVHWTRPWKMADKGLIESRRLGTGRGDRNAQVYSLASCERDFREYEDRVAAHGGWHERRPRAWLHLRGPMQARLANAKVHIAYDDACSTADAMSIMRLVSTSQITRLVSSGEIVARKAYNPRQTATTGGGSALWIISRKSCEDRQRRIIAAEAAGKKTGIRKFIR